jgi:hypothetical protein
MLREKLAEANGPEAIARLGAVRAQRMLDTGEHRAVKAAELERLGGPARRVTSEQAHEAGHVAMEHITVDFPAVPEETIPVIVQHGGDKLH